MLFLQLKCTASIFDVYSQSTEKVVLEGGGGSGGDSLLSSSAQELPQPPSAGGGGAGGAGASSSSRVYNGQDNSYSNNSVYNFHNNNPNKDTTGNSNNNVNMFQSSDSYSMHDFEGYGKEAYMTPIQGKRIGKHRFTDTLTRKKKQRINK